MSSYKSPEDLEKKGLETYPINKPADISLGLYMEIARQTQLLEAILIETKRVKNKLWNIEDCLQTPRNEPEYNVEG